MQRRFCCIAQEKLRRYNKTTQRKRKCLKCQSAYSQTAGPFCLGGLLGTLLGKVLPETLKEHLPTMFGLCSIGIGVNSVIKASGMTAVVLAILVGFTIGHLLHLEYWTSRFFHKLVKFMHLGGDDIDIVPIFRQGEHLR